jgi:DnaJ-class molecular chaperone
MSEAHDVLSDPKKRSVYDRFGQYSENLADAAARGAGPSGAVAPRLVLISQGLTGAALRLLQAGGAAVFATSSRTVWWWRRERKESRRDLNRKEAQTSRCLEPLV